MPPLRRNAMVAAGLALVLVVIGMWMVVAGWPMETPGQLALMDLAQLPMSAAVLVAIVQMTVERRLWRREPRVRFAAVFAPGAVLFLVGLVMLVVAFALPARDLVGPAQLLIWSGLGLAFVYLAVDSVRRELSVSKPLLVRAPGDLDDDPDDADDSHDDLGDDWLNDDEDDVDGDDGEDGEDGATGTTTTDSTTTDSTTGTRGLFRARQLFGEPAAGERRHDRPARPEPETQG